MDFGAAVCFDKKETKKLQEVFPRGSKVGGTVDEEASGERIYVCVYIYI